MKTLKRKAIAIAVAAFAGLPVAYPQYLCGIDSGGYQWFVDQGGTYVGTNDNPGSTYLAKAIAGQLIDSDNTTSGSGHHVEVVDGNWQDVFGGRYRSDSYGSGNVTLDVSENNSLEIIGGTVERLTAGENKTEVYGPSDSVVVAKSVSNNTVTMRGGKAKGIWGSGSHVQLNGGGANCTLTLGDVNFNTVIIDGGEVTGWKPNELNSGGLREYTVLVGSSRYVGSANPSLTLTSGSANNNLLIMRNGVIGGEYHRSLCVGLSVLFNSDGNNSVSSTKTGNANNNTAVISGGVIYDDVMVGRSWCSGYSAAESTLGVANYNALIWSAGLIGGAIRGGASDQTKMDGTVIKSESGEGNTLAIIGSGKFAKKVSDFQNYIFALDGNVLNDSTKSMLSSSQTEALDLKESQISVCLAKDATVSLKDGDTAVLMTLTGSGAELKNAPTSLVEYSTIVNELDTAGNEYAATEITNSVVSISGAVNDYTVLLSTEDTNSDSKVDSLIATIEMVALKESILNTRDIAYSNYVNFRSQMNDVTLRMGELRTSNKDGGWARVYGGSYKLGSGLKEKSYTLQVGADKWFNPNSYVGVTGSYTKADDTLTNGDNDQKNWNVGFYGGYVAESGLFVDAIVKYGKIKNEFNISATDSASGRYNTTGISASIEGGWRFACPNTGFYAEPQLELMYGRLKGVTYNAGEVTIKNDAVDTLVGRFGVSTGYKFAENKGNAYVKASVLHDFKGKVKTLAFSGAETDGGATRDFGGTWGEFVLGGNFKATDSLSVYGEAMCATKAAGVQTKWQGSVGVRYTF